VLSIANKFENVLYRSNRELKELGATNENYFQLMLSEFRMAFDSDLLKQFISMRGFYPNGTVVELTNRSICMVMSQNEGQPTRPLLKVVVDNAGNHPATTQLVDLRTNKALAIVKIVSPSTGSKKSGS